jgi:hypothetical protein
MLSTEPIMFAILLAVIASVYWTLRELILNTFKRASRNKSLIMGFAATGFAIALALAVLPRLVFRTVLPPPFAALAALVLCPSYIASIVFIDIPRRPMSMVFEVGLLTAVLNSAFYAAIAGRVARSRIKS